MVKDQVEALTGRKINIVIKDVSDVRNYKVTWSAPRRGWDSCRVFPLPT